MALAAFFRTSLSVLFPLVFILNAAAQQGAQTGSSTGSSTAGSTSTSQSSSTRRSSSGSETQAQLPPRVFFVTGSVAMSNGTPVPMGVVIERICQGRTIREGYVDPSGLFGFQLGAGNVMPDASDTGPLSRLESSGGMAGFQSGYESKTSLGYADCQLRAQLAGYRSNLVSLNASRLVGQVDVGTIILHPAREAPGTTVSVMEMLAPKKARKSLEKAEKAFQRREWDHAQEHLLAALGVYPRYASAWLRLGQVLKEMCRIDDARNALAKAIDADSNFVPPFIELARLAAQEGNWQEIVDLTDHAMKLDPLDFPAGFYMNALANFSLGRLDAAESSVRKAQRIDSQHRLPQTHLLLANILHRKRDHAAEVEQLRDYLKFAPRAADADRVRYHLQVMEMTGHR
jgi:tetratricopeptide (TPR) repeat protein